jgi:hypothetical protein
MFTMSPAEAKATIGANRLLILRMKKEAKSRLRPMDISPAMPSGALAMKHDDMATKNGAATTMQREQGSLADEKMDAVSSKSFALAGSADLSKHVGQRVSVTGSLSDSSMGTMRQDVSTLTIKTLKVVAKSCS